MKIAVTVEFSTKTRAPDVLKALDDLGYDYVNVCMDGSDDQPTLSYIETSFMAAACINLNIADYIVGGCGTGQGFCVALNQFPGMMCGHLEDPMDAWLFQQINGGNAISLMLNKDYGWAADINLKFILEKLFDQPIGSGFPRARADLQTDLREALRTISIKGKRSMSECSALLPPAMLENIVKFPGFIDLVRNSSGGDEQLRGLLVDKYNSL